MFLTETPPRVFISYSHDSEAHRAFVLQLANRLIEDGLDCEIDQYIGWSPEEGWTLWMQQQLNHADFVLMVCTERYRQCFEGEISEGGYGATHEGRLITKKLYNAHGCNARFIPVLPPSGQSQHIPEYLQDVSSFMLPDQYDNLYWVLTGQSGEEKPTRGHIRQRPNVSVFGVESATCREPGLEARVDSYLDWLEHKFLYSMDAFTEMEGSKRVRAQPQVRRRKFIVDDDFSELDALRSGCAEQHMLEEKTFDNILDALQDTQQGVFLGKPGAGKTTNLWKLAADEIKANAQRQRSQRIVPVVLRLGFWRQKDVSLAEFITAQTNVNRDDDGEKLGNAFSTLLASGRVVLILDGLNEMPVDQQNVKGQAIRDFLRANRELRAYASCREDDYSDAVRQPLPELHIQPLSIERIQTFIQLYLEAEDHVQASVEAERLFWAIAGGEAVREVWQIWQQLGASEAQFWQGEDIPRENPDVYSKTKVEHDAIWIRQIRDNPHNLIRLARNPYLLVMLMQICEPGEAFPENRGALLAGFYRQLVRRETDKQKRPKNNADHLLDGGEELAQRVGRLAWSMAEDAQTSLPLHTVNQVLGHDAPWLSLAIRCHVLEHIGDSVRFSHQLLQDYFIALGMKQRLDARQLSVEDFWRRESEWWQPTGWEEAVILLAGLYLDCSPVVNWLATANPKLAARCINESGVGCAEASKAALAQPWIERLTDLEGDPNPYARAAIGTALAQIECEGRPLDQRPGIGLDDNGIPSMEWLLIPAGEFTYQDGETRTEPDFQISRYPVTNQQFQAFVADGGYDTVQWWEGLDKPDAPPVHRWQESNRPVEKVSWYDAIAFCRWLSAKTGQDICLPTEQQWEKAARNGDKRQYPWGGDKYISGSANINETWEHDKVVEYNLQETSAVGIYPQQVQFPYELHDMAGNVWEWCLNKYGDPDKITTDLSNDDRVVRGGSWSDNTGNCRSSFRYFWLPLFRNLNQGFRCCCFPPHF